MGGREGCTWPNGSYPNGLFPNEVASVTQALELERWSRAEERTAELIACIQPNQPSEERRNAVASYVKCLIMKCFPCQVFTFGSVPLKTYLPDGDIDLTAFSNSQNYQNLKDNWANKVREILESEEKNEDAEFHVKEVQCINAEVKIIKCLVENIVVDISINQLGGLCTLCFLEEVDNFINCNHLYKRSIILIKAWCYYESRILGAHHGLISTYALETLVLYIFHVFDNSFAGPLEVLYRFLEFFSKFDWDNFCVSLLGPVSISSLPSMAADPPRSDGGELSLSKLVYRCMSAYTVLPHGQDNQEQPFLSKHFNIIDPLRMNNNLGRSVSKGNFFRIRSAFAFGARRLTRLLDCPKENLIAELDQFFTNTWERHGKGHRPDAPSSDLYDMRSGNLNKVDIADSFRNLLSSSDEVTEKTTSYESETAVNSAFHAPLRISSQHSKHSLLQMSRTGSISAVSHTECPKASANSADSVASNQIYSDLQNISSNNNTQTNKSRNSTSDSLRNEVRVWCQFARTHSSPELTITSSEVPSGGKSSGVSESGSDQTALSKSDNSRRSNLCPEVLNNHSANFLTEDKQASNQSLFHQSIDAAVDSNNASTSQYGVSSCGSLENDCHSVAETMEMNQEEQDFVNIMASKCYGFNGQVQMLVNLTSAHPPLLVQPSVLDSLGYSQKNPVGTTLTSIPAFASPWVSNMHYSQCLFPLPESQDYPDVGIASSQKDMTKLVDSNLTSTELNQEDGELGFGLEQNLHSLRGCGRSHSSVQAQQLQDWHPIHLRSNSSRLNSSDSYSLKDHRLVTENRGPIGEKCGENFPRERIRESDVNSAASSSLLSSQAFPSRTKSSSENYWDGSLCRSSKSKQNTHGRNSVSSTDTSTTEGLAKNGCQYEGESVDPVSSQADMDIREWIPLSTVGNDATESMVSQSVASSHVRTHQVPGYEPALASQSNSVLPFASGPLGSELQHTYNKNQEVLPFTYYPMWPAVPFLTMLPVYNLPTETGASSVSTNHFDEDEFDNCQRGQNLTESLEQSEAVNTYNSTKNASGELQAQHKTDILNSDFVSHLQNLQYGRFCQNVGSRGPLLYPSPVSVPPMYSEGHFPGDGPEKPPAENIRLCRQLTGSPHFIPVYPLQPVSSRSTGVYEHHGDEFSRYHSGRGAYLSNPKSFTRGQQSSSKRNHKGTYCYNRKNHFGEREGSWNTKPRFVGRGQGRNQAEKPNRRMDRSMISNSQSNKSWNSYENDYLPSHNSHNCSFNSSSSANHGSAKVASCMYPLPLVNPSRVSHSKTAVPPIVMLYPYDQNVGYGSSSKQLEFGSLGAVCFSGIGEASLVDDGSPRAVDEQPNFQDDSKRTTTDRPSPQLQRRALTNLLDRHAEEIIN